MTETTQTVLLLEPPLALVEEDQFGRKLLGRQPGSPWNEVDWDADPDWEWTSAAGDTHADLIRESIDGLVGEDPAH